jgi:hypothetical protein
MKISPKSFLSSKSTHHVNDVDLGDFFLDLFMQTTNLWDWQIVLQVFKIL